MYSTGLACFRIHDTCQLWQKNDCKIYAVKHLCLIGRLVIDRFLLCVRHVLCPFINEDVGVTWLPAGMKRGMISIISSLRFTSNCDWKSVLPVARYSVHHLCNGYLSSPELIWVSPQVTDSRITFIHVWMCIDPVIGDAVNNDQSVTAVLQQFGPSFIRWCLMLVITLETSTIPSFSPASG